MTLLSLPLLSGETACRQTRLCQFLDVQLTFFVLIQSFEFCFHKLHELLLGDHAVLVGIHKGQQLLDPVLTNQKFILRLRNEAFSAAAFPSMVPRHN